MNNANQSCRLLQEESTPAKGARILVLDDNQDSADLVGKIVTFMGHSPTVCTSPWEALKKVEETHFDLILTDFHMPEMNGEQFYRKVLSKHPELANFVIFMTGDTYGTEVCHFFEITPVPHIEKPFSIPMLRQAINIQLPPFKRAA